MVEVVAMVDLEEGVDEVATVVVDEEEEAAAVDHPFAVVGEATVTVGGCGGGRKKLEIKPLDLK
eukprot:scaffold58627_cov57-Attheya_sp.AAC.3